MTPEPVKVSVGGDISVEVAGHVSHLLRHRRTGIVVEIGDLVSVANLTPTPDALAMAAAVAAVLSFLLNVWKTWRQGRQPKKTSPADALEDQLRAFGADGFEIVDIEGIDRALLTSVGRMAVILEDVPAKQVVEVEMTSHYRVEIRRRRTS